MTAREISHAMQDLLAVIHGDGGHYVARHGLVKAAEDAEAIVLALRERVAQAERERDDLRAEREDWLVEDAAFHRVTVERDQLRAQGEKLAERLRSVTGWLHKRDIREEHHDPHRGDACNSLFCVSMRKLTGEFWDAGKQPEPAVPQPPNCLECGLPPHKGLNKHGHPIPPPEPVAGDATGCNAPGLTGEGGRDANADTDGAPAAAERGTEPGDAGGDANVRGVRTPIGHGEVLDARPVPVHPGVPVLQGREVAGDATASKPCKDAKRSGRGEWYCPTHKSGDPDDGCPK